MIVLGKNERGVARKIHLQALANFQFLGAFIVLQTLNPELLRVDVALQIGVLLFESSYLLPLFLQGSYALRPPQHDRGVGGKARERGNSSQGAEEIT